MFVEVRGKAVNSGCFWDTESTDVTLFIYLFSDVVTREGYQVIRFRWHGTAAMRTPAPQGCVSSPVLFTLHTNECTRIHPENYIIKFSNDTVILRLMHRARSPSVYHSEVERFLHCCDQNDLVLNVKKTEETVFDSGEWVIISLWSSTVNPSHRCALTGTLGFTLITHSAGGPMLRVCVRGCNRGCTFYTDWESLVFSRK